MQKKTKPFFNFFQPFFIYLFTFLINFLIFFFCFQKYIVLLNIIHSFDIPFLAKSIFLYHQILNSVLESFKQHKFQGAYINLNYFILLAFPIAKILELLAINHSSSKRMEIFASQLLKLSQVLVALQLAWVCTSPKLTWIT